MNDLVLTIQSGMKDVLTIPFQVHPTTADAWYKKVAFFIEEADSTPPRTLYLAEIILARVRLSEHSDLE